MKKKQVIRLLIQTFRTSKADKIIYSYILWFFLSAAAVWLWEPGITSYGDSLWLCFASATTIGYGDIAAVTLVGRIIIVVLSIYSIAVVAIFTAVITSFFTDLSRLRANNSVRKFIDELEHLPELSKEELQALSEKIKKFDKSDK